jgi:hypothetical protein
MNTEIRVLQRKTVDRRRTRQAVAKVFLFGQPAVEIKCALVDKDVIITFVLADDSLYRPS